MTVALFDVEPEYQRGSAWFSDDGVYRYALWRRWFAAGPSLRFLMLNPSTADADQDDPTIRRCIRFAQRDGYAGLLVLNLYAYRSADPTVLRTVTDPIGPENEHAITAFTTSPIPVVAAWGAHQLARQRGRQVAASLTAPLFCLGRNADGSPVHPLYVPADQPLIPWSAP